MITYTPGTTPREELQAVIVQGRGLNEAKKLIGRKILPDYGVNLQNAHLINIQIPQADLLRIMDKIVAPGADIEQTVMQFGDTQIFIPVRKEMIKIPLEVELNYSPVFSAAAFAANCASDKLDLLNEYLIANAIFNTNTFGAATLSAVAYTLNNLASISFISDTYAMIELVRSQGEDVNTIVIPEQIYQRIRQAPLVVAFVRGQLQKQSDVTTGTIQEAFADEGIEQVLIGRARYNTAPFDQVNISLVWPNTYIWYGRCGTQFSDKENGIETIEGVGGNLYWDQYGRHIVESFPWMINESTFVRAKTAELPYIANPNAGALLNPQYS